MPVLVYDVKLDRPACPILQAVFGGSQGIASNFDAQEWLITPTPDLKPYIISKEDLATLIVRKKQQQKQPLNYETKNP